MPIYLPFGEVRTIFSIVLGGEINGNHEPSITKMLFVWFGNKMDAPFDN